MRAKPAVPIAGTPLISRILSGLARHGVRQTVLNLHHLPETITACVGDGAGLGVQVRYSWESPRVLGSAGGPRKALPLLGEDAFFIINGDTLADVDLGALAEHHAHSGALVTMAVMANRWPERYGGVVTDSRGIVYGFVPQGSPAAKYHFVGVQIAHPSVFAGLAPDEPADSTGAVYRDLIARRPAAVRAFLGEGEFWDVGTPRDYLDTALAIGGAEQAPSPQIGVRSEVNRSARVTDSVIWDDVTVGPGATLDRCIVADGVTIPSGARYANCAIIHVGGELVVAEISRG